MNFREELQDLQAKMKPLISSEDYQLIDELIREKKSKNALRDGAQAPGFNTDTITNGKVGGIVKDFKLPDATNVPVSFDSLLRGKSSVILNFYRGSWCPFCSMELRALQRALPAIEKYNSGIIAISPQSPDNSMTTAEKEQLKFPVLSDVGSHVAHQFGIAYKVPDYLIKVYENFGLKLSQFNQTEKIELPFPATYVIDADGIIQYSFISEDFTKRADVDEIVKVVKRIALNSPALI